MMKIKEKRQHLINAKKASSKDIAKKFLMALANQRGRKNGKIN